jgi:hypothetical protein
VAVVKYVSVHLKYVFIPPGPFQSNLA